uniref:Lipoprotein n=1 Tax=Burkholderia sp. (strain CCGE1003) TaxID=640512 RepID=E1TAJ0_BURSG
MTGGAAAEESVRNTQPCRLRQRVVARALLLALATVGAGAGNVCAQSAPSGEPQLERSEVGHATSAWLALQRSNAQAAAAQPMPGEQAGLAYRRYMQSFRSRIPDLYGSALSQGNSGSQGVGLTGQLPQN